MKQENESTQQVSVINIYIYEHTIVDPFRNIIETENTKRGKKTPQPKPGLKIKCLKQYVPLFDFYVGYNILIDDEVGGFGLFWNGLFNYCQNTLLPLSDPWVQYTANEILNAKEKILSLCKKDLRKSTGAESRINTSWMTDDQVWKTFPHNYFIRISPEDPELAPLKVDSSIL